jgi:predicted metal-binding protein
VARIFSEEYQINHYLLPGRCNCTECGKRRICYNTELVVSVEALGGSFRSVIFPDLKQVCMSCAEERAFLVTGKRKVRM